MTTHEEHCEYCKSLLRIEDMSAPYGSTYVGYFEAYCENPDCPNAYVSCENCSEQIEFEDGERVPCQCEAVAA